MTATGNLYVGTSGFAYPDWVPLFYPPDTRSGDLLSAYASRLTAVELNNTFYRQPTAKAIDTWLTATPEAFRFVVKAQRGASWRAFRGDAADSVPWLTAAYREAAIPDRPRNMIGMLKDLPPAEMEALFVASVKVDDDALRSLANARARAVKDALVAGGIADVRVFLLAPRLGGNAGGEAGAAPTRVDLALR